MPTTLRQLARRHPIALFLTLVFGLGYPLMFAPLLVARGMIPGVALPDVAGLDTEIIASVLMLWLALFPAALIVTGLEGGRPALRTLLGRVTKWRIGGGWWALILLVLPVSTVVLALLLGDTFRQPTLAALTSELRGFLVGFLLINLWEETAWAGFLQTRLERRHNLYAAAALTAIPFAAIHMPLQVINGVTAPMHLAVAFLALTAFGAVFRSLLGLVLRGTGNSLLAVGLQHTVFNRSNNSNGIAAKLLEGSHRQVAVLVATAALTVVLGLMFRGRTGPPERARLDARER